ncbi:hypothetical protein DERF_007842 [Dermatophagoides farinae]|uniref:Uncharacterized protein n=1 Tax=Dermatophagoides farinae TaxID=6954 RepID=A0A922I253_DERFA|nr:hypothetical protein DERF_007842 [Dermatophagoides farinae]
MKRCLTLFSAILIINNNNDGGGHNNEFTHSAVAESIDNAAFNDSFLFSATSSGNIGRNERHSSNIRCSNCSVWPGIKRNSETNTRSCSSFSQSPNSDCNENEANVAATSSVHGNFPLNTSCFS